MKEKKSGLKFIFALTVLIGLYFGCDKISDLGGGDKLYFCEKYIPSSDNCEGKSEKYTTGALTVMVKLKEAIGVSKVDINITDLSSNSVVKTIPFDVKSSDKYIYFDGVNFDNPGKYKVSCLKTDGTVIVSNNIEIVSK